MTSLPTKTAIATTILVTTSNVIKDEKGGESMAHERAVNAMVSAVEEGAKDRFFRSGCQLIISLYNCPNHTNKGIVERLANRLKRRFVSFAFEEMSKLNYEDYRDALIYTIAPRTTPKSSIDNFLDRFVSKSVSAGPVFFMEISLFDPAPPFELLQPSWCHTSLTLKTLKTHNDPLNDPIACETSTKFSSVFHLASYIVGLSDHEESFISHPTNNKQRFRH